MTPHLLVMVVEDHDKLREATLAVLEQHGFEAVGLSCAEDIDDAPLRRAADLYIIDLTLPGEDGLSLAKRLREAQPHVGIIITTARTELEDRLQGYAVGADIYLPKPVNPLELVATLSALAKRLIQQSVETGLRLDEKKLLLRGLNSEVKLAESEARLLVALATAKDKTLERWQVAAKLCPGSDGISADNLQNRISQLRRKMQNCGSEGEVIKSIRSTGYRLCVPLVVVHE